MDVIVFRTNELPIALGALRATVKRLSLRQERYLEVIARLHGAGIRARRLRPVPPQLAAATIVDPHRRKRLVQLAIIFTTVDGKVTYQHARNVIALARELEVDEPALRTLPHLVARHALRTRFQVFRRIMGQFLRNAWREQGVAGVLSILGGFLGLARNRATAERYAGLVQLPEGTLGHELHRYFERNKFELPGRPGGMPERVLFHDIGHLMSGYSNEPTGEIQQAAFQAGFMRQDGFAFLFFGIIQFHLGIKCTPVAAPEVGLFDVEAVMTALARGARSAADFSDHWDFWRNAHLPLERIRTELGVPPLTAAGATLTESTGG